MPRYFMHHWSNAICDDAVQSNQAGSPLDYTAGRGFLRNAVAPGDMIYVVNVMDGDLVLVGRCTVGELMSQGEAWKKRKSRTWAAPEHVFAQAGSGTPQYFSRWIPTDVVGRLRFLNDTNGIGHVEVANDRVERASVRGVKEIDPDSATLLDSVLAFPYTVEMDELEESGSMYDEYGDEEDGFMLDDDEVESIRSQYDSAEYRERLSEAACAVAIRVMQENGYTYVAPAPNRSAGYDLTFTLDGESYSVIVKGSVDDPPAFLLDERELAFLEDDVSAIVCVVADVLSVKPQALFWTPEEFLEEFAMRGTTYAVKLRG